MQNFNNYEIEDIRNRHELRFPAGVGQTSFIDTRDIGAVAAEILLHPEEHINKSYTLTGLEALSYAEAAALFSEILNIPIRYIDTSNSTEPEDGYKQNHRFYQVLKNGDFAFISNDVKKILKRDPLKLAQYIKDYKEAFDVVA